MVFLHADYNGAIFNVSPLDWNGTAGSNDTAIIDESPSYFCVIYKLSKSYVHMNENIVQLADATGTTVSCLQCIWMPKAHVGPGLVSEWRTRSLPVQSFVEDRNVSVARHAVHVSLPSDEDEGSSYHWLAHSQIIQRNRRNIELVPVERSRALSM